MARVIAELVDHAQRRLEEARGLHATIAAAAMPAFLPVCLVDLDLKALRNPGFDALNRVAGAGQMARQWRMWRKARAGSF